MAAKIACGLIIGIMVISLREFLIAINNGTFDKFVDTLDNRINSRNEQIEKEDI